MHADVGLDIQKSHFILKFLDSLQHTFAFITLTFKCAPLALLW